MKLLYKPDFEEQKQAWRYFWAKEKWRRPLVCATVPKDPTNPPSWENHPFNLTYYRAVTGDWQTTFDMADRWFEQMNFMGEALPYVWPDFGPDQFAAFLGAELKFSEGSLHTNWVEPIVENWDDFQIALDEKNPTWRSILDYTKQLANRAKGRYLVGICDLHSNADTLGALRNAQRLCMDFYDALQQVENAMQKVRKLYQPVYDGLYAAGNFSNETGTIGWTPFWCEGKLATIQCDFICMVSPEISRKFIIPALEEEAAFLDHCVYHLDGPGALPHLDDILAIEDIDVIQWVSGAGQKPMWQWMDVLKKCQRAGKNLHIYDITPEQVKSIHHELGPRGVLYAVDSTNAAEIEELLVWLEKHS